LLPQMDIHFSAKRWPKSENSALPKHRMSEYVAVV
jgi:hypothetical protein